MSLHIVDSVPLFICLIGWRIWGNMVMVSGKEERGERCIISIWVEMYLTMLTFTPGTAVYFKCTKYKASHGKCPYTINSLNGGLSPGPRHHNHESRYGMVWYGMVWYLISGDAVSRDARLQLKEAATRSKATPTSVIPSNLYILLKNILSYDPLPDQVYIL